jgi:hypothetical protein
VDCGYCWQRVRSSLGENFRKFIWVVQSQDSPNAYRISANNPSCNSENPKRTVSLFRRSKEIFYKGMFGVYSCGIVPRDLIATKKQGV